MEILNEFGFKPELFAAQIVNFLILAFIFKKYLYKPILKVLKEREEKIKKGLEDAQQATTLKLETEEQRENILKKTRVEAEKLISEAKKAAEEEKERIIQNARTESDKIIKQGKDQANTEMDKIKKEVGSMSLNLSKKILDNILESLFSEKEKRDITKRAAEQLHKVL